MTRRPDTTSERPAPVIERVADAEIGDAGAPSPQDAPPTDLPVAENAGTPPARPRDRWWGLALWSGGALVVAGLTLSAYELVAALLERNAWLGGAALALTGVFALAVLVLIARELAALGRLKRVREIHEAVVAARRTGTEKDVKSAVDGVLALYRGRADAAWTQDGLARRLADAVDPDDKLDLLERTALSPLDERARAEVARAARLVAAATALMPSAALDAVAALYLNLRMIRQVAEIYGGRAGFAGSIRLARRVVEHAMAAGLIALGDDLLEPLIGGGVASKLSRRAGEGVVNGALTARIGIAAMEVSRPMPFHAEPRPKLRDLAWRAAVG